MRRIVSSLFVLALCAGLTQPTWAQPSDQPTPRPSPGRQGNGQMMLKVMKEKLDLTPEQEKEIQQILSTKPPGPERRKAINDALNPDQQAKFKQIMADMRGQRGQGRGQGGNKPRTTPSPSPSPSDE